MTVPWGHKAEWAIRKLFLFGGGELWSCDFGDFVSSFLSGTLPLCSAFWLSWIEQLLSTMHFHHYGSALGSAKYELKPLKVWDTISLSPFNLCQVFCSGDRNVTNTQTQEINGKFNISSHLPHILPKESLENWIPCFYSLSLLQLSFLCVFFTYFKLICVYYVWIYCKRST